MLLFILLDLQAQETKPAMTEFDKVTIGLGMGMDYGGFGVNLLYYPIENIGLFGGVGYALAGTGYNAGVKIRIIPGASSRVNLAFLGMYGYNAAIQVQNAKDYNKLFYGPTLGFGLDTHPAHIKNGYWSFAILIPVREPGVQEYIDHLKSNHSVEFKNDLFPFAISIGYRYLLF